MTNIQFFGLCAMILFAQDMDKSKRFLAGIVCLAAQVALFLSSAK